MSIVLNRLEDAGHITRKRHPEDGRRLVVTAAPTSADRAWELISAHTAEVDALVASHPRAAGTRRGLPRRGWPCTTTPNSAWAGRFAKTLP